MKKRGIDFSVTWGENWDDTEGYDENVYTRLVFYAGKRIVVNPLRFRVFLIFESSIIEKADYYCNIWRAVYREDCIKEPAKKLDEIKRNFVLFQYNEVLEMSLKVEKHLNVDKVIKSGYFKEFSKETLAKLFEDRKSNKQASDYFISRVINTESMDHFGLGYSTNMNMVTVPVHSPEGMPIGIVGRSIEGKAFKNSTNLPKSKTLFNVHRAKKIGDHVIVVESSFDAIRIHQAGFPNVVATLGGFLSTEQQQLLNRYFNRITVMTDADLAGRELGLSIANKLRMKDILWASCGYGKIYPHDAKDAGDMTDEEIKFCIKNAVSDIEYRSWNQ
jgi:hypothetical protein